MKNLFAFTAILLMSANAFAQQYSWMYYSEVGLNQLLKKEYSEAIKSFSACIKENQLANKCFIGRGKAHLGDHNISAARRDFESALKMNPYKQEAKYLLANNPSEDSPVITSNGLQNKNKLTDEDKKTPDNVTKSQDKIHNAIPKTEKQEEKKPTEEKPKKKFNEAYIV